MAGTIVDSLVIAVGLDGSKLGQDVQRVAQQADAAMRPVAEKLSSNFLAPFKGLLAPLIGALGITAAANEYMTAADAVGKLSDSLDIDIEDMQAWSEAAVRAGGSAGAFQSTVSSMTRQIQVAASMGKGPGATMLQELGIAFKDSTGKARDTLDVLRDLAGKAEGMSKQEFAGLAQKLGIDRGTIMLLQSGRQSLDELIARQRALGVYTKEDAEIAAKANDAMADFQQVIKALSAGLMRVFVPALTFVTEKLTVAVNFVREHRPFILASFGLVAAVLTAKMIPALLNMAKAGWAAMRPFLPWIIVLGTAALLIDDFYAYLQGGESLFADFWSNFGTGEEITKTLTDAWNGFKTAVKNVMDALKPYFPTLAKIAVGAALAFSAFKIFSTVLSFLSPVKIVILAIATAATLIYDNWEPISKWFKEKWEQVRTIFQNFKNWLAGIWNNSVAAVVPIFKKAWDGLVSWAGSVWELIKAPFVNTLNFLKTLFGADDTGDKWSRTWDALAAVFASIWELIKAPFVNAFNFIKSLFGGDDTGSKWSKTWDALAGTFNATWELIKAPFKSAYDFIAGLFGNDDTASKWTASWDGVVKWFTDMWNTITGLFEAGLKTVERIWNSVKSFFGFGDEAKEKALQAEKETRERAANEGKVLTYEEAQAMMGKPVQPTAADGVKASSMEAGKSRMIEQTNNSTVNVGKVEVHTPATDANGIVDSMSGALQARGRNMDIVYAAQTGTVQK